MDIADNYGHLDISMSYRKGAAYGRAEAEVRRLAAATNLPLLATPMGKVSCDWWRPASAEL